MFTTGSWLHTELLHYLVIPDALLFLVLGGLVLVGIWMLTKTPSERKVSEGTVVRARFDELSTKILTAGSTVLIVITPLVGVFTHPVVGIPAILWLGLVINHCVHAPQIGDLDVNESRLVVMLPAVIVVDCIVGLPSFLHGTAVLMTLGSALTAFILVERELENDKGRGDQSGGLFVTIATVCQLVLRVAALFGVVAAFKVAKHAMGWLPGHELALLGGASVVLVVTLVMAYLNVTIPIFSRERKDSETP